MTKRHLRLCRDLAGRQTGVAIALQATQRSLGQIAFAVDAFAAWGRYVVQWSTLKAAIGFLPPFAQKGNLNREVSWLTLALWLTLWTAGRGPE
ncbi:MAG: hypothetical protein ABIV25_06415 [Paracoccaceae bacterium]